MKRSLTLSSFARLPQDCTRRGEVAFKSFAQERMPKLRSIRSARSTCSLQRMRIRCVRSSQRCMGSESVLTHYHR
jgi:hypothetical protein